MERKTSETDRIEFSDVEDWNGVLFGKPMRHLPRYVLRVDADMADEIADRIKQSRFRFRFCEENRLDDDVCDIEFSKP